MSTRPSVLIVGVNYWPETTGIGPYTTGFAEHLARGGADVTVATAMPHYPAWRVDGAYDGFSRMDEHRNMVLIKRVRPRVPRKMSVQSRAAFELSFASRVRPAMRDANADVVIAVVPSLAGAAMAARLARRRHLPLGVLFQDLMGHAAEQSGMAGRAVGWATASVELRLARSAALVAVVAAGFSRFLESGGISSAKIRHLPNWCHISTPTRQRTEKRRQLGWDSSETVVLHAGNMGAKQALENVVEAARCASVAHPRIKFVLMGEGSRRSSLQQRAAGLSNLRFLEPQPNEDFPDVLAAADVLLINERPTVRDMSLPSKLTSYFAVGRPVVAAVRDDGTTAAEIRRAAAGLIAPPGDPRALLEAIVQITSHPGRMSMMGAAGRRYASEHLGESAAARRSVEFVSTLLSTR
jgi:glycosyltransferase involved in cell wall biosynthesis